MKKKSGFTLVELVVVMIILGILAGTAISKLGGSDEGAYLASMKSDARQVVAAVNNVYAGTQDYPDNLTVNTAGAKAGEVAEFLVASAKTGVKVSASPYTTITYTKDCADGNAGYQVAIKNTKVTAKTITYDSCADANLQL